ncbi:hypothetical protein [Amycolatopsis thermophila]|uniref:Uncharacterized protein n=1 Tax=Amycolatopsis thermophila TaxID=206084 RepID=A0ABU0EMT4_9PSEU|nr:hypothetical protein [Amycolatopsis thermophila]MDQ0376606.1 hypothetical protein [Amycolatopsis thermophila]
MEVLSSGESGPAGTYTAMEAVASGHCSGACLTAAPDTAAGCDCRCGGAFHGALADVEITPRPLPPQQEVCGARYVPDRGTMPQALYDQLYGALDVVCELPANHPPKPPRLVHHNGAVGMWEEPLTAQRWKALLAEAQGWEH